MKRTTIDVVPLREFIFPVAAARGMTRIASHVFGLRISDCPKTDARVGHTGLLGLLGWPILPDPSWPSQ